LLESKRKLVDDNSHFGLKDPEFPMVDEVQVLTFQNGPDIYECKFDPDKAF
jgi:hypothetical protein